MNTLTTADLELPLLSEHEQSFESCPIEKKEQQQQHHQQPHASPSFSRGGRLTAFIWLTAAFVASASSTPVMGSLQAESPILKASWRFLVLSVGFLPLFLREVSQLSVNARAELYITLVNKDLLRMLIVTSAAFLAWAVSGFIGSCMTNFLLGTILNNFSGLYLIFLGNGCDDGTGSSQKSTLSKSQRAMFLLVVFSLVVSVFTMDGKEPLEAAFGVLVTAGGAYFGTKYVQNNQVLTQQLPVDTTIFFVSLFATIIALPLAVCFEGASFTFNPLHGVFGIFHHENLVMIPFLFVITGYGMFKSVGMSVSLLGPELTSVALLFSPIGTAFEGAFLGLSVFPSLQTWVIGTVMMGSLSFFTLATPTCDKVGKVGIQEQLNDSIESDGSQLI